MVNTAADQQDIVRRFYGRMRSLPLDKQAVVEELAHRLGVRPILPFECGKALRGAAGVDYDKSNNDGLCWYKLEDFRRLYPAYGDLTDANLSELIYAKAGQPEKRFVMGQRLQQIHPWHTIMEIAGMTLGIPLAVLALGRSLFWAFSGFRNSPEANR